MTWFLLQLPRMLSGYRKCPIFPSIFEITDFLTMLSDWQKTLNELSIDYMTSHCMTSQQTSPKRWMHVKACVLPFMLHTHTHTHIHTHIYIYILHIKMPVHHASCISGDLLFGLCNERLFLNWSLSLQSVVWSYTVAGLHIVSWKRGWTWNAVYGPPIFNDKTTKYTRT